MIPMILIVMKRYVDARTVPHSRLTADSHLQKEDEFYTPGSDDLLKARRKIAEFSLARYVLSSALSSGLI